MKTTQLENMKVLILVFREDMLGGLDNWQKIVKYNGLNPCFSGRYAGRTKKLLSSKAETLS